MLLPEKFVRIEGVKVKVVVYDIYPLRENYAVTPIVLSALRSMARGTEIIIEYSPELLSEVTLSNKRIEDALDKSDADLLVFGSYVATQTNVQPMIHMVCTYGRPMEPTAGLPGGMDLNQAILDGDAILQLPRHVLVRDVLPVIAIESLRMQNNLAEEIFNIAQFIQAMKLYRAERFEETLQMLGKINAGIGSPEQWPDYWVPYNYLPMLSGLVYLRTGNTQAAVYAMSEALHRSTAAKMRIQRCAEQIISELVASAEKEAAAKAPEDSAAAEDSTAAKTAEKEAAPQEEAAPGSSAA